MIAFQTTGRRGAIPDKFKGQMWSMQIEFVDLNVWTWAKKQHEMLRTCWNIFQKTEADNVCLVSMKRRVSFSETWISTRKAFRKRAHLNPPNHTYGKKSMVASWTDTRKERIIKRLGKNIVFLQYQTFSFVIDNKGKGQTNNDAFVSFNR